jgi:hypothetical protein
MGGRERPLLHTMVWRESGGWWGEVWAAGWERSERRRVLELETGEGSRVLGGRKWCGWRG